MEAAYEYLTAKSDLDRILYNIDTKFFIFIIIAGSGGVEESIITKGILL
jgi:hypothetical protein